MQHRIFLFAAAASCTIHVVIAGAWQDKEIVIAGGEMAGEVSLGTSFADLVAGTLQSETPDGLAAPADTTRQSDTRPSDRVLPRTAPVTATISQQPIQTSAVSASSLAVISSNASIDVIAPTEARRSLAIYTSIRPVERSSRKPVAEPTPVRRGNADVTVNAGQLAGVQTGTVAQSSAAQQTTARQVGQGEIYSYKSSITSRVIRVAERMRSRGTQGNVVVGMQIAANGGLASVTIVQSSGNPNADAIALDAIRRAAPFGPTPTGQSLSVAFGVKIVAN